MSTCSRGTEIPSDKRWRISPRRWCCGMCLFSVLLSCCMQLVGLWQQLHCCRSSLWTTLQVLSFPVPDRNVRHCKVPRSPFRRKKQQKGKNPLQDSLFLPAGAADSPLPSASSGAEVCTSPTYISSLSPYAASPGGGLVGGGAAKVSLPQRGDGGGGDLHPLASCLASLFVCACEVGVAAFHSFGHNVRARLALACPAPLEGHLSVGVVLTCSEHLG